MRNLTKKVSERNERDLYRTPQDVIDRLCEVYRPAFAGPYLASDPCAGDGRIGRSVASAIGADVLECSDIYPQDGVTEGNALEWRRPEWGGRIIVAINPPFKLLDDIALQIWQQLTKGDELIVLISSVSLANYTRPVLWRDEGLLPFCDEYHIRWRCPFEMPDGKPMKGAAMCHQWIRSVKGHTPLNGMTRAWSLLKRGRS